MKSVKGTETEKNLLKAFAGESQARNRYTYFASRARKDGFVQIADIFEETANQEKEHAERFFKFLEGGELEITDLNRIYLENGELDVTLLGQGFTWLDTGTHESLVEATNFVKTVETHQHRKIACLEEIAYLNGWITKEQVLETYEELKKNQYGRYLKDVLDGKYIDKLHGNDMK